MNLDALSSLLREFSGEEALRSADVMSHMESSIEPAARPETYRLCDSDSGE
jgi:hypothetical protein